LTLQPLFAKADLESKEEIAELPSFLGFILFLPHHAVLVSSRATLTQSVIRLIIEVIANSAFHSVPPTVTRVIHHAKLAHQGFRNDFPCRSTCAGIV